MILGLCFHIQVPHQGNSHKSVVKFIPWVIVCHFLGWVGHCHHMAWCCTLKPTHCQVTRNFNEEQTQDNNKHIEILDSSLSPPDSGRHRKISLISDLYWSMSCGLASHTHCFTSSRTCFVKRIYFFKYFSNQCFMALKYGSRTCLAGELK